MIAHADTGIRLDYICPVPPSAADPVAGLLLSLAQARGCATAEEATRFLDPLPKLEPEDNPLRALTDIDKGVTRITAAMRAGEVITIFGDYDCDGVTSMAQWVNLFRAAAYPNYRVYIPDRFIEDYGLTIPAVDRCLEAHKPTLVVSVDCGSSSKEALEYLRSKKIDVVVIDHHQVHIDGPHPSFAHLNPKGDPNLATDSRVQDAAEMSAAGLCFFVCEIVAERMGLKWDRDVSLLLAGLGTYVDVMPLTKTNRVLVKRSIALANSRTIDRVPGIRALLDVSQWGDKPITDYTYGFVIGPCLNASGRLAHAKSSLSLVCSTTAAAAQVRAQVIVASNTERKQIQEGIYREALAQAQQIVAANPDTKVLLLYGKDWHTGVVGIVAGKIKEAFHRPTLVLARLENGYWKGSGRSIPSINIGGFVAKAVKEKVLTGGGGHAMACGVKLTDEQLAGFVTWVRDESATINADMRPLHEVIGDLDWLSPQQWAEFFRRGAPFGQGNPRPGIAVDKPTVNWGPEPLANGANVIWAMKASISTKTAPAMTVTWSNIDAARRIFAPHQDIRLILEFSRSFKDARRYFDNWRVSHGELMDG